MNTSDLRSTVKNVGIVFVAVLVVLFGLAYTLALYLGRVTS